MPLPSARAGLEPGTRVGPGDMRRTYGRQRRRPMSIQPQDGRRSLRQLCRSVWEQILQRIQRLLRKALQRIVLRDDAQRVLVRANVEKTKEEPDILFIMELRSDAQGQAFHREQILRLRCHHPQVIALEKRSELARS